MKGFSISAPGKIILHGEHAVVYEKKALAASTDLRTTIRTMHDEEWITFESQSLSIKAKWHCSTINTRLQESGQINHDSLDSQPDVNYLIHHCHGREPTSCEDHGSKIDDHSRQALKAFFFLYTNILGTGRPHGLTCQVESEIPVGAGLGSSAAFSVCLSATFLFLGQQIGPSGEHVLSGDGEHKVPREHAVSDADHSSSEEVKLSASDHELIARWSLDCERIFHGKPSGVDNTVALHGGLVEFQAGDMQVHSMPKLQVLIVNTKVARNTRSMVHRVQGHVKQFPSILEPVLTAIDAVTSEAACLYTSNQCVLTSRQFQQLQELVAINHHLLNAISVGHDELDFVVREAKKFNLAAKLTGAGGGGCAMVLLPQNLSSTMLGRLKEIYQNSGYSCYTTSLGGHGLKVTALRGQGLEVTKT